MALEQLRNKVLPIYDQSGGPISLQLDRVCVDATVTHDDNKRRILDPKQEAAEPGDDEDEDEHHLKQLTATTTKPRAASSRPGSGEVDSRAGTTSTLVANVQSATFTSYCSRCALKRVIPNIDVGKQPKLAEERYHSVIWLVQQQTLNLFHTRDEDHTAPAQAPEAKRFKGVRYRPDHNRWVAEMKPPRSKNKVSFGEFRSQSDAARIVDVAFQQYGRPLNFPDSAPHILPSADVSGEAKLEDIRKQTKRMKREISSPPPPNRSISDPNSGPRPFFAIWRRCHLATTPMAAGSGVSDVESEGDGISLEPLEHKS